MKAAICAIVAVMVGAAVAQGGLGGGAGLGGGLGGDGRGDGGLGGLGGDGGWGWAPPKYKYNYGVKDGWTKDIKQAYEHRDGGWTEGAYSLLQPDGLTRTVKYTVSPKGGFQAKVSYSGWGANGLGDGAGFGNGVGLGGAGLGGAGLGGAGLGGAGLGGRGGAGLGGNGGGPRGL